MGYQSVADGGPIRPEPPGSDAEREGHEAEHRDAVLDSPEGREPEQRPHQQRHRNDEDAERVPGRELERQRGAANLRRQHQQIDKDLRQQRPDLEPESESLADGRDDRMMADSREPAGHLDEKRDAAGAERDPPKQAVTERRPGLNRRADRTHLEIAANARENAQADLGEILHPDAVNVRVPAARSRAAAA